MNLDHFLIRVRIERVDLRDLRYESSTSESVSLRSTLLQERYRMIEGLV